MQLVGTLVPRAPHPRRYMVWIAWGQRVTNKKGLSKTTWVFDITDGDDETRPQIPLCGELAIFTSGMI